jgi:osmoprotectant transport system permease protein
VLAQARRPFPDTDWVGRNLDLIGEKLLEHLQLTALSLLFGLAIAIPLAVLAVRFRVLYTPLLAITGVLFTIPSLALFVLILVVLGTGLTITTAVIGLTIYSLLILFRNTVAGLDSVPADIREAADAMGYTRRQRLFRVEFPVALPVIVTGIRIATVTTIGLVTVTALIGQGGLGRLFLDGFRRRNTTELVIGFALSIILAVVADLALLAVQRGLTPWARSRRA